MNSVTLTGRLTKDPDVRTVSNNKKIAAFTIAVDGPKDANGNATSDFISCKAFSSIADFIEKYIKKGYKVGIRGQIKTGKYTDKNNIDHYTTDVWVKEFENFTNWKQQGQAQATTQQPVTIPQAPEPQMYNTQPQYSGFNPPHYAAPSSSIQNTFDVDDDDVPF